ncbi:MAG: hypothetical protein O3A53_14795 [Acidobacteria bacterium]|nr:hypothetical protein [Acidobacteriota bacterium]MDA1236053.1 hypothetical protein [Acidobacteriota bacterium]
MAEATPDEGSLSLHDAASLLDPEEDNSIEDVETDDDAVTTEPEEEAEADTEDEADTAEDDEDLDDDDEEEPDAYLDVLIDGQSERVTLDEARKGYQREADYRRKTMALADQRKALEAEAYQAAAERQQYAQAMQLIQNQIANGEQEPDWERLKIDDPFEYLTQRDEWREKRDRVQMLQQHQARLQHRQSVENHANLERELGSQREILLERIPAWRDAETANSERVSLSEYAQTIGFSQEEVDTVIDARAVELLHKAWKFDNLMNKGAEAKRVKLAPPSAKSGQPGSRKTKATRQSKRALDRLSRTGRIDDAVDFLLSNDK